MAPIANYEMKNNALTEYWNLNWDDESQTTLCKSDFSCRIAVVPEEDGTFSAIVLNLPGAGSCGDTEEDALNNAREAIRGVIESHRDSGEDIPWCDVNEADIPANATLKWIVVNV